MGILAWNFSLLKIISENLWISLLSYIIYLNWKSLFICCLDLYFYCYKFQFTVIIFKKKSKTENIINLKSIIEVEAENISNPEELPKDDKLLLKQTKGEDAKGNIRYFCPKCNVRYIGKFNLTLWWSKSIFNQFFF